jgi:hypothetical protein
MFFLIGFEGFFAGVFLVDFGWTLGFLAGVFSSVYLTVDFKTGFLG